MRFITIGLLVAGCSTIQYSDDHGTWSRTAIGTDVQLQRVVVRISTDGARSIEVNGMQSDQTEALRAVAEGAARGAASVAKP